MSDIKRYASESLVETTVSTINDDLNTHKNDKNNPHGVSAEQVGAAPAGFGLGENAKLLTSDDDLNQIRVSGWYKWGVNTGIPQNAPLTSTYYFRYAVMEVSAWQQTAFVQKIYNMADVAHDNVVMMRTYDSGPGEWEWVNPPMVVGDEYRTTERINGKAVYKRNNGGIIEYRLDGETAWKPYAEAVGALNALNTKVISAQKSLSSPGWYRIAFANGTTTIMSISISSGYNNNAPMHLFADIALNAYRPKILIKTAHSSVIDKIRIVRNSTDEGCYLDVYYTDSAANPVQFNAVCLSLGTVEERDFVLVDETADGETVVSILEDIKSMTTALESNGYVLTDRSGVKKSGDTMTDALKIESVNPTAIFNSPHYSSTIGEVGAFGTGVRLTNRKKDGTYNSLVVEDPDSSLDEALKLLYQDKVLYNILHTGNVGNYALKKDGSDNMTGSLTVAPSSNASVDLINGSAPYLSQFANGYYTAYLRSFADKANRGTYRALGLRNIGYTGDIGKTLVLEEYENDAKKSEYSIYHEGNKPTATDVGAAPSSHNHDDRYYTESEVNNLLAAKAPSYQYGPTDLTAGSSSLTTGTLYFVYEGGSSGSVAGGGDN